MKRWRVDGRGCLRHGHALGSPPLRPRAPRCQIGGEDVLKREVVEIMVQEVLLFEAVQGRAEISKQASVEVQIATIARVTERKFAHPWIPAGGVIFRAQKRAFAQPRFLAHAMMLAVAEAVTKG
jgi:hypothetical protein